METRQPIIRFDECQEHMQFNATVAKALKLSDFFKEDFSIWDGARGLPLQQSLAEDELRPVNKLSVANQF